MLISQPMFDHVGKTIASVKADHAGYGSDDLIMARSVHIVFTDGSELRLCLDWRGDDAYISQVDGRGFEPKQTITITKDPGLTPEAIEASRKEWTEAMRAWAATTKK